MSNPISPDHYRDRHPGWPLECIEYARRMPYTQAAAFKYAWRAGRKDNARQDWSKAIWYLHDALDHGPIRRLADAEDQRRYWRAPTLQIRALALIYCGQLHEALAEIETIIKEMP